MESNILPTPTDSVGVGNYKYIETENAVFW